MRRAPSSFCERGRAEAFLAGVGGRMQAAAAFCVRGVGGDSNDQEAGAGLCGVHPLRACTSLRLCKKSLCFRRCRACACLPALVIAPHAALRASHSVLATYQCMLLYGPSAPSSCPYPVQRCPRYFQAKTVAINFRRMVARLGCLCCAQARCLEHRRCVCEHMRDGMGVV